MSRRSEQAAQIAASQASEAARLLQARQQETLHLPSKASRQESNEPARNESSELNTDSVSLPEKQDDDKPMPQIKRGSPINRESVMDQIRAARGETDTTDDETPEKPVVTGKPVKAQEAVEKPADAPHETPAEPVVETVRVKVDGQEFDVPKADVEEAGGVGSYQREKAEENRLKRLNESIAESKRTNAAMMEWLTRQQTPQTPNQPQVTDAAFIQSKLDIIRFGTPEEGAQAWVEIQERQAPKIDPNNIANQVMDKVRRDAATQQFQKDFADVVKNPMLLKLAIVLENERLQEHNRANPGQPIDYSSFYSKIGNEVRSVTGRPSQPATVSTAAQTSAASEPGTPSQVSDKEARKSASIVNLPTAAARAVQSEDPKPETREQAMERMRRSRVPNM